MLFDWDQGNISEPDTDWENHIGVFLGKESSKYVCAEGNTGNKDERYSKTDVRFRSGTVIQGFIRLPDGFHS